MARQKADNDKGVGILLIILRRVQTMSLFQPGIYLGLEAEQ